MNDAAEPFILLADPSTYEACNWDLNLDASGRVHWVEFFCRHIETILRMGVEGAVARDESTESATARAVSCRREFIDIFQSYAASPAASGRVTILTLDTWRDQILRRHGFVDAFIDLKDRENAKMLPLLPAVCAQLDAMPAEKQFQSLIEGIFAGNIFDMGAEATAKAFLGHSPDFFGTRANLKPRPWLIDDFDALSSRMLDGSPHRKCVFFIDNAGSDFLLGAIPMIRWMAQRGTRVIIAANERPTLNDMTVQDVRNWWPRILTTEPSLAPLPIHFISTGTGEPLIDLAAVSPLLNSAVADADLIVLEGMGRGVESNLDAKFSVDAINLAMIKDEVIASRHGGALFDVVCQYRQCNARAPVH